MSQATPLAMGLDLGTSGVRIVVINENGEIEHIGSKSYSEGLENFQDWKDCSEEVIREIPLQIKQRILACAVDGTSGTLIACDHHGSPISKAIPYFINCPEQKDALAKLAPKDTITANLDSSLARALRLVEEKGPNLLLRHQADWINGWLMNNWAWGEEGNNLKLGWDLTTKSWPKSFESLSWRKALPNIAPSGSVLDNISPELAKRLQLPQTMLVIAGTTDSNAAVLSTNPEPNDGITVLGSTIVLKRFTKHPILGIGVTNHRVAHKWLCGGASNAGCAVLKRFFSDKALQELSMQINPNLNSGLMLRPISGHGERFPKNDPYLEPILKPRPISDSLYLHGLLEGLTRIEFEGWQKLIELGAPAPQRLITIGGGAKNPQWRSLRQRIIGLPIKTCKNPPALGVARLALDTISMPKHQRMQ